MDGIMAMRGGLIYGIYYKVCQKASRLIENMQCRQE